MSTCSRRRCGAASSTATAGSATPILSTCRSSGCFPSRTPRRCAPRSIRGAPTPPQATSGEAMHTTHYSVVDEKGNAVSVTTTLNGGFGSGVTVTGAGFLLNNEMDDFASADRKPNMYGLVQGEANSIAPGKRMLSAMTPSIVLDRGGNLFMVVGTPGGPTIITTVAQVILN